MIESRAFTDHDRRHFVRYTRTRQWPMLQRYPVADELHLELLAQMLACTPETVRTLLDCLDEEVRSAAATMLTDDRYRAAHSALPFGEGDRVVAVGDSITADRLGWFELLTAAGLPGVRLENLGVSGNTTADVLERFDLLTASRPTHVLLMLGTNDAREHGHRRGYRMATNRETERNLRALIDLIQVDLNAAVTTITPPCVDPARIATSFADQPVAWHASEVSDVAAVIREIDPSCVDLHAAMQTWAGHDLLEADGVHPNPAGHQFILTQIVEHLGAGKAPCRPDRDEAHSLRQ